jgi:biotin-dependent carboxylase-like uncharacterized protein
MTPALKGLLDVVDGGFGCSIQDLGRRGFRHMGITVSGHLDSLLARCANALVGNPPDAACIEIRGRGPTLRAAEGRIRLAIAGEISATLHRADGDSVDVPAWKSVTLAPDERLQLRAVAGGVAYLAVAGGIATPLQLGSRSTYQRALIGGIDGLPLATGQVLPCTAIPRSDERDYHAQTWRHGEGAIRVILGPQQAHFAPASVATFLDSPYEVTPQMDRMGVRLAGAQLAHRAPADADIVSDGVTPGAIQVPGNGQPIILLADCQTVGGYPKIATVISADLPRLGQLRPGQSIRFCAVDARGAREALVANEERWAAWARSIAVDSTEPPMPPSPSATLDDDFSGVWISSNW